ncbi:hypothetical protein [Winogradskyella sp. PG-2]|uniref:hypothetical protein n=1 Tax=Winogradskyella sp. PG-2 TaxID=754409 RepID=UPI000458683D|nr:hypothetical protein [Winogradskyella sp. PG-2]BAO75598.1 hypothetical protein WPG_1368 [Winogradskyella sp. PG-2]
MKLKKRDIKLIDNFLEQKGIKYLDVRSELLDHLASEFEEKSNYSLLEDYLVSKIEFIKSFAKKQQKMIHWSYQKQLLVQFSKFFYKPKFILTFSGLIVLGYILLQYLSLENFSLIYFFVLVGLVLYPLFYQIKYSKAVKKVQSMQSLFTVTALPSVFLYTFSVSKSFLLDNFGLLLLYYSFSILLGISAVIIIENDRKKVLKRYYELLS